MRTQVSHRIVSFVAATALLVCLPSIPVGADNGPVPSWRIGISEWNGQGYDLPKPVRDPSPELTSGLPYTLPVDPKKTTSGSTPKFEMPLSDPKSSLSNDVPVFDFPNTTGAPTVKVENAVLAPNVHAKPAERGAEPSLPQPDTSASETSEKIAEKLSSQSAIETPPLQEEVVRWYDYPRRWMRGWNSHAEFGLDGSSGNSDTLALQTGLELKRKSKQHTLGIDVDYRQASSRNVTVEDNGRFNVDYDYLFKATPWSGFAKYGMEWDKFKAFDLRLNLNGGIGYFWIRDDVTTLVTRFGAGASKEIGAPVDDWIPEAVFGLEAERQLTSRQKIKGKVDYFPAWENFDDYRLVTDLAWEILLDGSDNLSLKLAATDRYDSTPQGARPNDLYYSMLLLYKF